MVTNSYLGEYVVDINTPLIFFPRRIFFPQKEDHPMTDNSKTPSSFFFFFLPPSFPSSLVRDGGIIYLKSLIPAPGSLGPFPLFLIG